eukprot:2708260-Ditylum_brightwellii.AAC.2
MLRPSRLNPRISAETQLNGMHDFNHLPLAPPGTKVIVHKKSTVRGTWAPHGVDGWYLGPAVMHYQRYKVYITSTHSEWVADTVESFPTTAKVPHLSSADAAARATLDLIQAIKNPQPATPFPRIGNKQMDALQALADIFNTALKPLKEPPIPVIQPPTVAPAPPPRVHQTFEELLQQPLLIPQMNVPQKPALPPRVEKKKKKSGVENLAQKNDPAVPRPHHLALTSRPHLLIYT